MTVHFLPRKTPSSNALELPRAHIVGLLQGLNGAITTAQVDLMTADNAEDFACVLAETHATLTKAGAGFASLGDVSRHWGSLK
jgi:hypothetical protein